MFFSEKSKHGREEQSLFNLHINSILFLSIHVGIAVITL